MSQQTINPYPQIGKDFKNGLIAIIAGLPTPATVEDLVDQVYNFIDSTFYSGLSGAQKIELRSIIYTAINCYINGGVSNMYSDGPNAITAMMTVPTFINSLTVDSLGERISDIEDNITKAGLSINQQTPYFLATVMGTESNSYWIGEIASGASPWQTPYFDNALAGAIINVPWWVAATMEGALIGSRLTPKGMITPTDEIISTDIISSLVAALVITAGKVIFKWVKRIQNIQLSSAFNGKHQFTGGSMGGIVDHVEYDGNSCSVWDSSGHLISQTGRKYCWTVTDAQGQSHEECGCRVSMGGGSYRVFQ
jgi:hypothetical protein